MSTPRQVLRNPDFEQRNEPRIHVLELVRNVEADYLFPSEMTLELRPKLVSMGFLHHEDDVGPLDKLRGCRNVGIVIEPAGRDFYVAPFCEDGLSGRTSQLVLAAHKEEALQMTSNDIYAVYE
jgi:hypothetical protein